MGQYYIYPNELTHYGVLGMKWGVRRYQNYDGTLTDAGKRHYSANGDANNEDRAIKKQRREDVKNRRTLSDKELNDKVTRLQKEKQLRELTDEEINTGKKRAQKILKKYEEFNRPARKILESTAIGVGIWAAKIIIADTLGPEAASGIKGPKK